MKTGTLYNESVVAPNQNPERGFGGDAVAVANAVTASVRSVSRRRQVDRKLRPFGYAREPKPISISFEVLLKL